MLVEYRKEIENIDLEIAKLFNQRFEVVKKIKSVKEEMKIEIEDKDRETYLKARVTKEVFTEFEDLFSVFYDKLIELSKEFQQKWCF